MQTPVHDSRKILSTSKTNDARGPTALLAVSTVIALFILLSQCLVMLTVLFSVRKSEWLK
jgi:hypothetical protein